MYDETVYSKSLRNNTMHIPIRLRKICYEIEAILADATCDE